MTVKVALIHRTSGSIWTEIFKNDFKSQKELNSHYEKHQKEFGNISKEEYLQGARNLVNSDEGGDIMIKNRVNGDTIYYNKVTNEFAVKDSEGFIKTYFKPESGIDYFNAQ